MDIASATAFLASTATASGLTFPPGALEGVAQRLVETVERDATGSFSYLPEAGAAAFRVQGGAVVDIPVGDFLAGLILQAAKPVATAVPAPGSTAPAPTRPKPGSPVSEIGRALAAQHDAAMIRETADWPNPFIAGSNFNRTRQQILINKNPALAAKFKTQARA